MKIEVYERIDGKWDWRLKARNGLVLCGSDQGYEKKSEAVRMSGIVVNQAHGASTVFITQAEAL